HSLGCVSLGLLLAALGFVRPVRRALARIVPIDADNFVHTVSLVTVVAMTAIFLTPLLVLGMTPGELIPARMLEELAGQGASFLRSEIYSLAWLIPCTVLAVGFGIRRNLTQSLARIGLVRPTLKQVMLGVGLAIAMVAAVMLLNAGINWLWTTMG